MNVHVVPAAGDHRERRVAAVGVEVVLDDLGVVLDRHNAVAVAVDVKDADVVRDQAGQPNYRVVQFRVGIDLGLVVARVAQQVGDRVDPADGGDLVGVVRRPVVAKQAAPAAGVEAELLGVAEVDGHLVVEVGVTSPLIRVARQVAGVDARDGDAVG